MATIGWIDFSTNDRNRVGSVLDLLRPEGMVDELGMGTIRDALSLIWGSLLEYLKYNKRKPNQQNKCNAKQNNNKTSGSKKRNRQG